LINLHGVRVTQQEACWNEILRGGGDKGLKMGKQGRLPSRSPKKEFLFL
jgi:hypothetical protein